MSTLLFIIGGIMVAWLIGLLIYAFMENEK